MKKCTKCKEIKSFIEFNNHIRTIDGKRSWCKKCESDKAKEDRRIKLQENPVKTREFQRAGNLKRVFNMTIEEWNVKFNNQQGVCEICKGVCKSGKRLAVDHNHKTGKIRDLLCGNCNGGLGKFLENQELLLKAIDYLKKHDDSAKL